MNKDIIIGIDAGTSVLKAVAFDLQGKEISVSSLPNIYNIGKNGEVTQSLNGTWKILTQVILNLNEKIENLKKRIAIISITGQGDGTWLIDKDGKPVCDAWLWLDSRSSKIQSELSLLDTEEYRFNTTGTGIFSGQQSCQLLHIKKFDRDIFNKTKTAFHCKDWLYYKLTGVIATDPSEACFTFGNFRTRDYDNKVIDDLGLSNRKDILPEIIDGSKQNDSLNEEAAKIIGLNAGTPVSLSYIDAVCSSLGGGGIDLNSKVGFSSLGSTSAHMKYSEISKITPNQNLRSGYVMLLPIEDIALQLQTNMSGTLNFEWLKSFVKDIFENFGINFDEEKFINNIDNLVSNSSPGTLIYHPYISEAGERGPFINSQARASFIGLRTKNKLSDFTRSLLEGLCFAAKECYLAMGDIPKEIRVAGGGSNSNSIIELFSSILSTSIRKSNRNQAGAAGAAIIGAMSLNIYNNWNDCFNDWVNPYLGKLENHNEDLSKKYDQIFNLYLESRDKIMPVWKNFE